MLECRGRRLRTINISYSSRHSLVHPQNGHSIETNESTIFASFLLRRKSKNSKYEPWRSGQI